MITRRQWLQSVMVASTATSVNAFGAIDWKPNFSTLAHRVTDAQAPIVYFCPQVSAEALTRVYDALMYRPKGKVAIKTSFEGHRGPYVKPELLAPLAKVLNATLVDTNGFSAPRNTTASHRRLTEELGFAAVAPIDILDAQGDMDLPVPDGFHLHVHRVGSHFANYDDWVSLVKYKMHNLPMLGGHLKNLSITLASISGKCNIHSAGANLSSWQSTDDVITAESITDAAKAAMVAKKDRWVFLSVMDAFVPKDSCQGSVNTGDVGVFASVDPVALDQVCTDITLQSAPDETTRKAWEKAHTLSILEKAEKNGVGKRHYRLVML